MNYPDFVRSSVASFNALPAGGVVLDKVFGYDKLQRSGTWAEFGVASGASLRRLTEQRGQAEVWGFDVFSGLPEDWRPEYQAGAFAQSSVPEVPGAIIVVGLFQDILPSWKPLSPITFVHIDCDIYSAAKCALSHVVPYLENGAVIAFDEMFNYPGFEKHELRALYEVAEDGLKFDWLFAGGCSNECSAIIVRKQ